MRAFVILLRMAAKRITSVGLTAEQLQAVEAERVRIEALTGIKPSVGATVRATLDRALADQKKAS